MLKIKKTDPLNWIIYSKGKIKKGKNTKKENVGKIKETIEGFYPNLETACICCIDKKLSKKFIKKEFDTKKILKAIKKAKNEIIEEIRKNKKG